MIVAAEWLDDLPCRVVHREADGWREVVVDEGGDQRPGPRLVEQDLDWADRWWPAGQRAEIGLTRDRAWSALAAVVRRRGGCAIMIDYGHHRDGRRRTARSSAYRDGRSVEPLPSAEVNLTAHVSIDSVRAAGESAGLSTVLGCRQGEAMARLGSRPPPDRPADRAVPAQRTGGSRLAVRLGFALLAGAAPLNRPLVSVVVAIATTHADNSERTVRPAPEAQRVRGDPAEADDHRDEEPDAVQGAERQRKQQAGHGDDHREHRRRAVTLRREATGQDQAGRDQGQERQRRSERVDQAGGAHPVRDPRRRAGREAHGRVGLEDPADDQPDTVDREEHRAGDRAATTAQVRDHRVREDQAEQPGQDEVGALHPAVRAVGQQAQRMADEVVALAGEDLDHGGGDEDRTGHHAGEQGAATGAGDGRRLRDDGGRGGESGHGGVPLERVGVFSPAASTDPGDSRHEEAEKNCRKVMSRSWRPGRRRQ